METRIEEIQKENILFDLKISKIIQKLNQLRSNQDTYTSQKDYALSLEQVRTELEIQKNIDNIKYLINFNRVPELVAEVLKQRVAAIFYPKLSQIEKEFLSINNYDYAKDKYNLFNNKRSPDNTLVKEWQELQFNKIEESYINKR